MLLTSRHLSPVTGKDIPGREVPVGPPALRVGLHVEHGEHAPVGQVDDAPDPRSGAGAGPGSSRLYWIWRDRMMIIT